ncbi:DUF2189 domain-containing protein [Azohydromonas lata]|uniref:DUF2189 domain-containing protein n=1 Tax=Azohydromonas lata TaxID=45677 RepID=A0ABU5ILA5_9BURK|nr:DUF2189 domain-containing protein [Azohydromonas lata]MDZ5459690.1 DUF2189 domain-containing protein [Azohydromonas lata]
MDHTLDRHSLAQAAPTSRTDAAVSDAADPEVRAIGLDSPWRWLRMGWRDVMRSPAPSLGLGVLVAAVGMLLTTAAWKATYVAPALLGGFLLVGPFLAIALYGLAQQLEAGQPPDLRASVRGLQAHAGSIAMLGLMLALAYILWERSAAILFAFYYQGQAIKLSQLLSELMAGQYLALGLMFLASGALAAAVVFALTVVSAPLLVDRPVDVVTAAMTSLRCCRRNALPLLVWAAIIAALTLLGFLTAMLGLIFVFPLLAHASWHAYRDMVERGN